MSALDLAHSIFTLHLAFILFAVMGGALVWWRPAFAALHLPALVWGVWIELSHGRCPLTSQEQHWLQRAGVDGYGGGFVEHYIVPLIYPAGLTPGHQVWLAAVLVAINLVCYGMAWRRHAHRRSAFRRSTTA